MEMRFTRDSSRASRGTISLQKKLGETRIPARPDPVPDISDFMNDLFFGTVKSDQKAYNLTGTDLMEEEQYDDNFSDSSRHNSTSRLTQEWLEEAKRMVASSPARCDSPSRLIGSPRFVAARASVSASALDRRDPLSRSARRHRPMEGVSEEILLKSAKHSRNDSELLETATSEPSPASAVHKWFSDILKPSDSKPQYDSPSSEMPHRQSVRRKSRFQTDNTVAQPNAISIPPKRTFKTTSLPLPENDQILSPPKNLIISVHRRSNSSSTCSLANNQILSPPKRLVESAHRRSISSSTCSIDKFTSKFDSNSLLTEVDGLKDLNSFLKHRRAKLDSISSGEMSAKATIVLSGPSNSTSSMVAAICYAWLLENKGQREGSIVAPVINIKRGRMWKHRQAAWLFQHVGINVTSLLFSDEVDLESLMIARKLSIMVVGEDVLRTNGEVGSLCTILTDNYCEDAYDLLETPILNKLLLAGILLDTQNLNASAKLSMTRDSEAVQLLLAGSAPNYRNTLFDQLMQDQREAPVLEAMRRNYGKPPTNESSRGSREMVDQRIAERKSTSAFSHEAVQSNSHKSSNDDKSAKNNTVSPKTGKTKSAAAEAPKAVATQAAADASRGKNKFFLTKWFGFGSK